MNVRYESAFEKDLKNLNDKRLLKRIKAVIEKLKSADTIEELNNLKKLSGYDRFYRIRVSDYRIGIEASEDEVIFVRLLHRKDVYRYFP